MFATIVFVKRRRSCYTTDTDWDYTELNREWPQMHFKTGKPE